MKTQTLTRSFVSGILSPELHGRTDLPQYQSGLKTCLNWIVKPSGAVTKRPGLEFGVVINDSPAQPAAFRLFPFQREGGDLVVLQTEYNFRFVKNNKYVLEARRAVSSITTFSVVTSGSHGLAANNMVFIGAIDSENIQTTGDYWFVSSITNATTFVAAPVFHTNTGNPSGAYVSRVHTVTDATTASLLPKENFAQSQDVLTITSGSGYVRELTRVADNNWTIATPTFAAQIDPPPDGPPFDSAGSPIGSITVCGAGVFPHVYSGHTTVISSSIAHTCRYKLTSISNDGEESVAGTDGMSSPGSYLVTGFTSASVAVATTSAAHGLLVGDVVSLQYMAGTGGGTSWATLEDSRYRVATTPSATTFTLSDEHTGVVLDTSTFNTFTSGSGVFLIGTRVDLSIANSRVGVAFIPSTDPEVVRYNVYKQELSTGVYGYAGTIDPSTAFNTGRVGFLTFIDDNIVPDVTKQPPEEWDPFATATTGQPSAVAYHEQRRVFGGSTDEPQRLWLTPTGFPSSMNQHFPILDSDAFDFKIFSKRSQRVKHIVSLGDLMVFTGNSIHQVSFNGIVPSAPARSFVGASDVSPVECEGSVVFVSNGDERPYEVEYARDGSSQYVAIDISVFAPDLFEGFTITSLAYCRGKVPTLWVIRSDGQLLSCTYAPSQEVRAWHTHSSDGADVKSLAAINEGGEDRLYAVMQRTVDSTTYYTIERMASLKLASQNTAMFLDSSTTAYAGTPALTLTGLWHLEGQTVNALADGVVVRGLVVDGGTATFPVAASQRTVGLPYTADLETLPLALQIQGAGMGRDRNADRVSLRLFKTQGLEVGPDFDNLVEPKPEIAETYSTPAALITGEVTVPIETYSDADSTLCIRSSDPLPATISALSIRVSVSG